MKSTSVILSTPGLPSFTMAPSRIPPFATPQGAGVPAAIEMAILLFFKVISEADKASPLFIGVTPFSTTTSAVAAMGWISRIGSDIKKTAITKVSDKFANALFLKGTIEYISSILLAEPEKTAFSDS